MDIKDAIGRNIEIGKTVRYTATGTTGEVEDLKIKDDSYWVKIQETDMWYIADAVEVLYDNEILDKEDYYNKEETFNEESFKEKQSDFGEAGIGDNVTGGG